MTLLPLAAAQPRLMSHRSAFVLLVTVMVSFLAGSSTPTALYPIYQHAWAFGARATTLIFGVYALSVLAALLVAGSLSDHLGRRPVLIATTLIQAVVMGLYLGAHGVVGLIVARVVQGLATGAAAGAIGAALLDRDRAAGAMANAVSPMLGTASGAVLGALGVQWLPAPTHSVYGALFVIFLVQALLLTRLPETAEPRAGALASLRPRLALPPETRGSMRIAVPIIVAAWSLTGLHGALSPSLTRQLAGRTAPILGGVPLAALAAGGMAAVLALRRAAPLALVRIGALVLIAGMALTESALARTSLALFLLGTVAAGVGFGAGFQGAIRLVLAHAPPASRAGVLSVLYIVAYLAMGVPAMIAGLAATRLGVAATAAAYGAAIMALAAVSFAAPGRIAPPVQVRAAFRPLGAACGARSFEPQMGRARAEPVDRRCGRGGAEG